MIERLIIVAVAAAAAFLLYRLTTRRQLQKAAAQSDRDPLLAGLPHGLPTIVYFTTPDCAPCQLQQTPTLQRLQQEMGDTLAVVRVDAAQDPDAAARWGVFSVPTTFVLDLRGKPQRVFNGVVSGSVLKDTIQQTCA
jgi:thiol-disulfide isomerase/thioredoxin